MKNKHIFLVGFCVCLLLMCIMGKPKPKAKFSLPTESIRIEWNFGEGDRSLIIEDKNEVQIVNEYLSSWDPMLWYHEPIDLACEITIYFDGEEAFCIASSENYGRVKGDDHYGYCFPEAFVVWLREKVAEK